MYRLQYVLPLVAVYIGFAYSWDFAVSRGQKIEFYTNDIKTDTVSFSLHNPTALAYDEVRNIMLFVNKGINNDAICGYGIYSKEITCFTLNNGRNIHGIALDPATSIVYFTDVNERSINYVSLNVRRNEYGNLLIKKDLGKPTDIVVESCRGYIYWISIDLITPTIERAYIDGSDIQVIVNSKTLVVSPTYKIEPHSLAMDQHTRRLYWMEPITRDSYCIYFTDWNGNGKTCLNTLGSPGDVFNSPLANTLSVSKSILYFGDWGDQKALVFKIDKMKGSALKVLELQTKNANNGIVANFGIKEQVEYIKDCVALTYIHVYERKLSCDGSFCVHGTKILGQALCKCPPGFKGDRCDVSICDKYCLRGTCTVNDAGLPICSCRSGYSGKRCGVNICHGYCQNDGVCSINGRNEPVCQCRGEHTGDRCEVSVCHNYCQNDGVCSVNDRNEPVCQCRGQHTGDRCEGAGCLNYCIRGSCSLKDGLPQCKCDPGYSGERCEINMCHGYCQNNGVCSVNDRNEPVCQCRGQHTGDRCEGAGCLNYCIRGSCSLKDGLPQCKCDPGYSSERCEINMCHGYCQNNGVCSVNDRNEPVCQCRGEHTGDRCERAGCLNYCIRGSCSLKDGLPQCKCDPGYSSERCEINMCHGYCQNNGVCSVNDRNEPVCQCRGEHTGDRCERAGCLNYCIRGSCSLKDGLPQCKCDPGYSSERCEINMCHSYCQNNGVCSVNDRNEPVCQCRGEHTGDRCERAGCLNYCIRGSCSLKDGLPQCKCDPGYSGERCEINMCHGYCQNNGVCFVNDRNEPVCQCRGEHTGDRCERAGCLNYCIRGSCSLKDGLPQCKCDPGYSGERCGINMCHGYCQNNGVCSVNDRNEPVCQCRGEHTGDRCERAGCLNYCIKGSCSLNDGLPQCRCETGYSGDRCEVEDCHGYCLNGGVCSLNEADEASCECPDGFEGTRCEENSSCRTKE